MRRLVGIARSTAPSVRMIRCASCSLERDSMKRTTRSVSPAVTGSTARAVLTCWVNFRAIRARSAGASA